ncbi:YbaB/EbfC family nucleoid-associated protein [Glycomyces buryatensis]|uniref:YbaB/EbfC family nucleoid-associated protein n=1 Tax=Glycomyces buryatensis TaxID=2570927 RepID=A0A4S8PVA4_9ACTN|nr:YbaB/EbfC family nucleoid-associated protein [Glycomyces buryatensis]THV34381.1 YbaB/EbfC family nucleoid-associated protein [Glycomyces buryatensis]
MNDRPSPEAAMAKLEQMRLDAEETLRKYEELQEQAGANAVETSSDDGLVRVKLDGDGQVAEINIDEYAMRQRQTLSYTIVELIERAQTEHAEKMAEMAQAMIGDKVDLAAIIEQHRNR